MEISLTNRLHSFEKMNGVTLYSKKYGHHDMYKCAKCGIEGIRIGLHPSIFLQRLYDSGIIRGCKDSDNSWVGVLIVIRQCSAAGPRVDNLTPDSIHVTVAPPDNEYTGDIGVWVMGTTEPVKILWSEFSKYIMKRTKKRI